MGLLKALSVEKRSSQSDDDCSEDQVSARRMDALGTGDTDASSHGRIVQTSGTKGENTAQYETSKVMSLPQLRSTVTKHTGDTGWMEIEKTLELDKGPLLCQRN